MEVLKAMSTQRNGLALCTVFSSYSKSNQTPAPVFECAGVRACVLVVSLPILSFNLDSSIDIVPNSSCYNFLDLRYYAA